MSKAELAFKSQLAEMDLAEWSDFWQPTFISYRRCLLDQCLNAHRYLMTGVVLDLGGKRQRKRGTFRPPEAQAQHWLYVNVAPETRPDVLADVTSVPFSEACADCIVCTEVMEHLPNPVACVNEIHRLLKPGGVLIASVPFLYPGHADPDDYWRFTPSGLKELFREFASVEIATMGATCGTLGMLIELGAQQLKGSYLVGMIRKVLRFLGRTLSCFEAVRDAPRNESRFFSTGYFLVARKARSRLDDTQ